MASYGGTLSGEHGDGRARSELLPLMYSAEVLDLFGRVKAVLDPDDVLNPGVLVAPRPVDADLRLAGAAARARAQRCAGPTTAAPSSTPCTAAPASASAWPHRPAA